MPIPKPTAALLGRDGKIHPLWWQYLSQLSPSDTFLALQAQVNANTAAIDALEQDGSTVGQVFGIDSVQSLGLLPDGEVRLRLLNDQRTPGPRYVYGTDEFSVKGWHSLADVVGVVSGGEILVQDGSSAPPVMLTNEAEDDFIYSG